MKFEVKPYGIDSVFLEFGNTINLLTHKKVKGLYHSLRKYSKNGIKAVIPSYCALTILFEPSSISLGDVVNLSSELLENIHKDEEASYLVRIPVCYDHEIAIDWKEVCDYTGKKWEEIIYLHTKKRYLVYMLGFVPGFFYLGGLPTELEIPRKKVPRLKVEMGSVGLADNQTGIYPIEIPGGWQIIGRTPVDLINDIDVTIEMGDYIEFYQISKKEFHENNFKIKKLLLNGN